MPRLLSLSLVALAAGCYDLPDIERDVCGNQVIDGKEDCDGFSEYGDNTVCGEPNADDPTRECVYVCDPAGDGSPCPAGWGCGLDGVCNRPAGGFVSAPLSPWHMPVDEFAIGDVDGDRRADLIGNDPAHITVRFGSDNAEFPDQLSTPIRRPSGAVTYAFFDNDDKLDAIVPIDLGLFVLRGAATRTLESVSYSPFSSGGETVEFHNIQHPNFVGPQVLIVNLVERSMEFLTDDPGNSGYDVAIAPPDPEAYDLQLPPSVGEVNGNPRPEFALSYHNDNAVHIYSTTGDAGGYGEPSTLAPVLIQSLSLPPNWRVHQGTLFAQVDGANELDLVISAMYTPAGGGASWLGILVAYNTGSSLAAPIRVEQLEIFTIPQLGLNLPLASADFDKNGLGDYATPMGLFMARGAVGAGSPPQRLDGAATSLPDLWSDAAVGDFNGDGEADVAVARFDAENGRVLSGVDFFLYAGLGLFNPFHIQTEEGGPRIFPRSLTVGDFDGDLIDDVAFFQDMSAIIDSVEARLMVAFGAADGRFADASLMGRFPGWVQMTPSDAALSPGSLDGITDLFVVSYDQNIPDAGSSIAVMFGDSSRRMVAPLILDPSLADGGAPQNPQQPRRALVGDFNEDGVRDLLALTDNAQLGDGDKTSNHYVWYIPGIVGDGSVNPLEAVFSDMADSLEVGDFNFGCSTWEVVDLERRDDAMITPDELIGLDDSSACAFKGEAEVNPEIMVVRIDPASATPMQMSKVAFDGDLAFPDHLAAADFDDDGDLDPVVLFQGSLSYEGGDPSGGVDYSLSGGGVGVIWNDGARLGGDDGVVSAGEFAVIPLPDGIRPIKVAAIGINEDAHKDLLILTEAGVYMALREPSDERAFQPPIFVDPIYEGRLLGAGDVNGDGLTDFAVVAGQNVSVMLALKAPRKGEDPGSGFEGPDIPVPGAEER